MPFSEQASIKKRNNYHSTFNFENMTYRRKSAFPSPRLPGFNYDTKGAYFITICVKDRACHFGEVKNGMVELSPLGKMVEEEWKKSFEIRPEIALDEWVIMPNHFHAIIWIHYDGILDIPQYDSLPCTPGYKSRMGAVKKNLSSVIRGFKGAVKRKADRMGFTDFLWQKSFYDRIIRDEEELNRIRIYIRNNPARWLT